MKTNEVIFIGITGTNGKTTTSYILEHILTNAGIRTKVIDISEIRYNEENIQRSLNNYSFISNQIGIDEIKQEKIDVCIIEIRTNIPEMKTLDYISFDIIINTNIELDFMIPGIRDDYIKLNNGIFKLLKKNGISIINTDDKDGLKLIENNSKAIVLTYGFDSKASITASSLKLSQDISYNLCIQRGITALNLLEIEPMEIPIRLKLMGRHNIYNSLAAICGALCVGVNPYNIEKYLCDFKGIDRRLNLIYENDYKIIDNHSHNPLAYEVVFDAIQVLDFNRLIIINSLRGNGEENINKNNAKVIASWYSTFKNAKLILTLSKDSQEENNKVLESDVIAYKSVLDKSKIDYMVFNTLEEAIKQTLDFVNKNDLVLFLGAQEMNKGKEILYKKLKHKNLF